MYAPFCRIDANLRHYAEEPANQSFRADVAARTGPRGFGTDEISEDRHTRRRDLVEQEIFDSSEGATPCGGLTLSADMLFGTMEFEGDSGYGTVFELNTNGAGFMVLKQFSEAVWNPFSMSYTNSDGGNPVGFLTQSGTTLYGATRAGGNFGCGTVFKLNTDGAGYTVLKQFSGSDGANPFGGLALLDGVLYGTTGSGGTSNLGTVFKLNTDGTAYSVLKEFHGSDGAYPSGGLVSSGGVICGTTRSGGGSDLGTVFKLNTGGSGYTVLKHFAGSDGAHPSLCLLSGDVFYGTAEGGSCCGIVFKLNTDGTDYTVLKQFNGSDGAYPFGLALSGRTLYGATSTGNDLGWGELFKIDLGGTLTPIPLTAQIIGGAIILQWSSPAFTLQSAPTVMGDYTNIPAATSPYTNAISEPQQFFRLLGN